ncbi:MAG: hypothetical protein MHPSP_002795, partial [Paramarteilia canceri]
ATLAHIKIITIIASATSALSQDEFTFLEVEYNVISRRLTGYSKINCSKDIYFEYYNQQNFLDSSQLSKNKFVKKFREICTKCQKNSIEIIDTHASKCFTCPEDDQIILYESNKGNYTCYNTKCPITEYFDSQEEICKPCQLVVGNSNGRAINHFAYYHSCSCSNDAVKLILSNYESQCFEPNYIDQYKDQMNNALENNNYLYTDYTLKFSDKLKVKFMYCNPFERYGYLEWRCLCNEGFQFIDGKCRGCLKPRGTENLRNYKCQLCLKNSTHSDNHEECLCNRGYFLHNGECSECSVGYYKENVSNNGCKKCPKLFKTPNFGSKSVDECKVLIVKYVVAIVVIANIATISLVVSAYFLIKYCIKKRQSGTNHNNAYF